MVRSRRCARATTQRARSRVGRWDGPPRRRPPARHAIEKHPGPTRTSTRTDARAVQSPRCSPYARWPGAQHGKRAREPPDLVDDRLVITIGGMKMGARARGRSSPSTSRTAPLRSAPHPAPAHPGVDRECPVGVASRRGPRRDHRPRTQQGVSRASRAPATSASRIGVNTSIVCCNAAVFSSSVRSIVSSDGLTNRRIE